MATKNPRLNVVLEPTLYDLIKRSAKKERISLSLKARDLIKEAIELEEDIYFQQAAQARERTFSRQDAPTHKTVWK